MAELQGLRSDSTSRFGMTTRPKENCRAGGLMSRLDELAYNTGFFDGPAKLIRQLAGRPG